MNESSALCCNCNEVLPLCDFVLRYRLRTILLCDIAFVQFYVHELSQCHLAFIFSIILKAAPVSEWLLDF
jgi:hypothetical protein